MRCTGNSVPPNTRTSNSVFLPITKATPHHTHKQKHADTPEDAKTAVTNGAQGIGLCRTEHMFFATPQRIAAVRRMIAAAELHSPLLDEALAELQGYQTQGARV